MDKFNEVIKKAKAVRMKPEEKSEIRARLYATFKGEEVLSSKFRVGGFGFRFLRPIPILASLMIAVLAGGGVSFASENSLPGDLLYPVKIGINEGLRARLAISAEAKATWDAERAERRLAEVEQLSDSGELTDDRQAVLVQKFEEHADRAQERLAELSSRAETKAADKVSAKIENVIKKHGRILAKIGNERSAVAAATVAAKIDLSIEVHNEERSRQESKAETVAEKGREAAINKISEVREFLSGLEDSIRVPAEERLRSADQIVLEADTKGRAQLPGEAFILYRKAHRLAQEVKDHSKKFHEESDESELKEKISGEVSADPEIELRSPVLPKVEVGESIKGKVRIGF